MKIAVVGTSNSVMGMNGFIQSLKLEHDVIQLSSGRVPFYCCLKTILLNRDLLETCDLLIIDHYVNDVAFYGPSKGRDYRTRMISFYEYISTLNVNVLNLMFPMSNLKSQKGVDIYHFVLMLCERFKISILDLNILNIPSYAFKDPAHINHDASYALGLALIQDLQAIDWERPSGGVCFDTPFSLLIAKDIDNNDEKLDIFENSLLKVEYLKLEQKVIIERSFDDRLIAIGSVLKKSSENLSGIVINEKNKFGLCGVGYFMEAVDIEPKGVFSISPLKGEQNVINLMRRGISKGDFNYCYISELIFFNEKVKSKFIPASRSVVKLEAKNWLAIADRIMQRNNMFNKITPSFIDGLRNIAVSLEGDNLKLAEQMMTLAHTLRPNGPFIQQKLAEYTEKLKK